MQQRFLGAVGMRAAGTLRFFSCAFVLIGLPAQAVGFDESSLDESKRPGVKPTARAERVADPAVWRVGTQVDDVVATDLDGKERQLSDFAGHVIVIALRDVNCPLCRKYAPRLSQIELEWRERGVRFLYVNVQEADSAADMTADKKSHSLRGPYFPDREGRFRRALSARTTTEVFVLDSTRTLRYRGAVDDQYGIGSALPKPRTQYLVDAIEQVHARERVRIAATTAPGCALPKVEVFTPPKTVTYHEHVQRIVAQNCQGCHYGGGPAPFPLETYNQVRGRRGMIEYVLEEDLMPPWFTDDKTGPWENDARLSPIEKAQLLAWIAQDSPRGDPTQAPEKMERNTEWKIGKPDLVVPIPEPIKIRAEGVMNYRYAFVQVPTTEDRWIERMEIRPTVPQAVHHVLVFLEAPLGPDATRQERRRRQEGLRGYFAGMVPGQSVTDYPPGMAKKLPAGSWLKFQIHYTPNGIAATDRTEIAFGFTDQPPVHEMKTSAAAAMRFKIPPGDSHHVVKARYRFREPGKIYSFAPHMHLRGKAFKYELQLPNGKLETLLEVPRFDFDWQYRYKLMTPREVPKGATLRVTGVFDNSADNPSNPDPKATVRFGEQTFDEMMIGYFEWYGASSP